MSKTNTKVITPKAILSYPHLVTAQPGQNGGKPKFSASLVFLPGTDLAQLKAAAVQAIEAKWPGKVEQLLKSETFKKGFRTDGEEKGYPAGSTFINVRSEQKPGVVFSRPGPDGKTPAVMTDEDIKKEMYPGALVRASVTAFAYDTNGNKGVSFALNNLQKLGEGDRLDNRVAAENEFDADLSQAPADLSSLI